ncbi:ATP-binding protein [Megalodesulfovibrio gigas]|uniref:histidine kinase n=1 Tax=Megalodesulfovibrio gigas (strain ATCC 19364 / DSM 1382 / NCIMB 9332 / VKM B-1759) TaxID=1121448 RepID=T2G9H4_MEGG1|nr:ATP-binding protein [Megalodesulfovibrio gigas]AGW12938.1 putative signal transduction histidine kinase, nitrogen specific [Megalodesulfovibrio gigas DSM 1382 = ATCC 19364]
MRSPTPSPFAAGLPATAWAVAGAALILALVVGIMAWMSAHRAKQAMSSLLLEKGEAIITAVEAGARTGLRGHRRGMPAEERLQILLEEMAAQPNVLFLALTDARGRLQLHSGSQEIGGQLWNEADMAALAPGCAPQWRIVEAPDGKQAFLVYRAYSPLAPHCSPAMRAQLADHPPGARLGWCSVDNGTCPDPSTGHALFVGLDITPFDAARRDDLRNTALLSLALLVLGGGGVASLFWARDARQSRLLLARSQTLAAEALTQMPAGCLVVDPSGRIDRCNATAAAMLGLACDQTGAEAGARTAIDHLPSELAEAIRPVLQEGLAVDRELLLTRPDAEPRPVQLTVSAMPPGPGTPEQDAPGGALVILRDLTDMKRLQDAVRRRDKLAAVGSLAAGVAHEIRNPLGAIKAAATFFSGQFPAHSDGDRMAALMLREVDRLNRVVGELLELGRPSGASLREVAIGDVVDRCISLLRFDLEQQHIAINNAIPPDLPAIHGDADKLLQALLNLMLNAMEAMHRVEDRPRVLTLAARLEPAGAAHTVVLEVRDTGPGIPDDLLPTLFTPYVTTRPQGAGLGLAVVQQIMEAHHGEVRLANAVPGPGAVAALRFPGVAKEYA